MKRLTKRKKIVVYSFLAIILLVGAFFSFPKFIKYNLVSPKEEEIPEEEPIKKLSVIDLDSPTRPIAVMINNLSTARKYHAGLQDAYLVYEMIVEGGITRLMALYKDKDTEKIGSIRSARHYYLDYALENDAIYVHWGYSEYAQNDIVKLKINNVNGLVYGNYFWKDRSLKVATEHTAYSNISLIQQGIERFGYRTTSSEKPLLHYSVDPIDLSTIEGVVPAEQVAIKYSSSVTTSYTYDHENKNYKRFVNGDAHVDYDTKEQYTTKNIITYQVSNHTIQGDVKGRQDLSNIGSGTGYFISDGFAIPITWLKKSRDAKTIYKLLDGTDLIVNDGNTYIQIQPSGQSLTIS